MDIGIIIRNSEDDIMTYLYSSKRLLANPVVSKALTLRMAQFLCTELGFMEVSPESDYQVIVRTINNSDVLCTDYKSIVLDTQEILSTNPQWKIEFVFRKANRATDLLANLVFSFPLETVWIEEGPYQIQNTIIKDKYSNCDT